MHGAGMKAEVWGWLYDKNRGEGDCWGGFGAQCEGWVQGKAMLIDSLALCKGNSTNQQLAYQQSTTLSELYTAVNMYMVASEVNMDEVSLPCET